MTAQPVTEHVLLERVFQQKGSCMKGLWLVLGIGFQLARVFASSRVLGGPRKGPWRTVHLSVSEPSVSGSRRMLCKQS